jgi:hypothetical protein
MSERLLEVEIGVMGEKRNVYIPQVFSSTKQLQNSFSGL